MVGLSETRLLQQNLSSLAFLLWFYDQANRNTDITIIWVSSSRNIDNRYLVLVTRVRVVTVEARARI